MTATAIGPSRVVVMEIRTGETFKGTKVHWAKDTGRVMYWSPCGHELININQAGDHEDVTCKHCIHAMGLEA